MTTTSGKHSKPILHAIPAVGDVVKARRPGTLLTGAVYDDVVVAEVHCIGLFRSEMRSVDGAGEDREPGKEETDSLVDVSIDVRFQTPSGSFVYRYWRSEILR